MTHFQIFQNDFLIKGGNMKKHRIEFDNRLKIADYRHIHGGWIALQDTSKDGMPGSENRMFWYDYHYTRSEILVDLPFGSFTIQ